MTSASGEGLRLRQHASRTLAAILVIGFALAVALTVLVLVAFAMTGTSSLGVAILFFFIAPALALIAGLVTPQLVLHRLGRSRPYAAASPTVDGLVVGFGIVVVLVGLALAINGALARTGATVLTVVACALAVPVGLYALRELLYLRWSKTGPLPSALASLGFISLIAIAALPSLLLSLDPYRNLPLAVVDENRATDSDWAISGVEDFAPDNVRMTIVDDEGRSVTILITNARLGCDERYLCTSTNPTSSGSPVVALGRNCQTGDVDWPNVAIERPDGLWRVQSSSVRRFCDEEGSGLSEQDLIEVAGLLVPATTEAFLEFDSLHS